MPATGSCQSSRLGSHDGCDGVDDDRLSRTRIAGNSLPSSGPEPLQFDQLAEDPPIEVPASIVLSISAAPRSTMATAQNQNNNTMTPPRAPSEL